jgi:[1-hydroxy-2-(trimethylamino)ethyl]phosphonate dioxygenase
MSSATIIDQIFATFRALGDQDYGEEVPVLEHSLQAAYLAELDNAGATVIAAAVLHDYGHLIHDLPEDSADRGIDAFHEEHGAAFLADYFIPEVVEPVRLHVAAKRYLCGVDLTYHAALSEASAQSLWLQGGPMGSAERAAFEASPHFAAAIQLRHYDDLAKTPGAWTPGLEHYRPYLEEALHR